MKKTKRIISVILCVVMLIALSGCAALDSTINDIKGNLVGNSYTITTYDNYDNNRRQD